MKYYKYWIRSILVIIICSSLLYYCMQLTFAKKYYRQQVKHALNSFLTQQQDLLQKLGQQLTPMLLKQDYAGIAQILNVYEDQIYVLAKHGFTVPVAIQFVSLNAPQQIINSNGALDHMVIAPDDAYYMRAAAAPTRLEWSKVYTQDAMPQHKLINLGYGVQAGDKYLGHLDAQMALTALESFLTSELKMYARLFKLQFANNGLEAPTIILQPKAYWSGIMQPTLITLGVLLIISGLLLIFYKLFMHIRNVAAMLMQSQQQLAELSALLSMYKSILATQYKYGSLALLADHGKQLLNVQQLLHDIKAVNADLIQQRAIKLNFATQIDQGFYIQANNLSLMQILSGILYEILIQLPNGSAIDLQITVQNINRKQQKIVFKFTDNGFYTTLQEHTEQNSNADIRVKGWGNIKRLISLENADLEHVHTAYVGNTISLSVVQHVNDNVINLAF